MPRGHIIKSVSLHPKVKDKCKWLEKPFKEWDRLLVAHFAATPSLPFLLSWESPFPLDFYQPSIINTQTFQQGGPCLLLKISFTYHLLSNYCVQKLCDSFCGLCLKIKSSFSMVRKTYT